MSDTVEPREGICAVYDHDGYVGCIGSETWAQLVAKSGAEGESVCVIVYDMEAETTAYVRPGDPDWPKHSPAAGPSSVPAVGGGQPSERDAALEAAIAEVGNRLRWNVNAYGKAWTGEDEDTLFICEPLIALARLAAVSKDTTERQA